jgi:hypothetical protein
MNDLNLLELSDGSDHCRSEPSLTWAAARELFSINPGQPDCKPAALSSTKKLDAAASGPGRISGWVESSAPNRGSAVRRCDKTFQSAQWPAVRSSRQTVNRARLQLLSCFALVYRKSGMRHWLQLRAGLSIFALLQSLGNDGTVAPHLAALFEEERAAA